MTLYRSSLVASLVLLNALSPGCGGKDSVTDTGTTMADGGAADGGGADGGSSDGGAADGGSSDGGSSDGGTADGGTTAADIDGDGVTEEEGDCDDNNAAISPDLAESCNGIDDNCDGNIDEGFDVDGDGVKTCADIPDCDDTDAARSPLLVEVPGDEVDNDCDLLVDEGDWAYGDLVISELMINPFAVTDGDGEWFEVVNQSGRSVFLNGLTIMSDTGEIHTVDPSELLRLEPGAMAVFGPNGDTSANGGVSITYDYDHIYLLNTTDSLSISAGDVMLDEVTWGSGTTVISGASWSLDDLYLSADGNDDTRGWCLSRSQWADGSDMGTPGMENDLCSIVDHDGDGFLIDDGDCDDRRADVYPGASDAWYDGLDSDCAGDDDYDSDGDGYESDAYSGDDCDDTRADINPGQDEVCDDLDTDEDCNGFADTSDPGVVDGVTMYADADGDAYGSDDPTQVCEDFDTYLSTSGDCDDTDADINPGATETWYDGVDSDCAGDDDYDSDADGYDSDAYGGDDCDDTRADVNPGQDEICDDLDTDEDCNGVADDDDLGTTDAYIYYPDSDGDGYGSDADRFASCDPISGSLTTGGDCDDADDSINPAATETWYDGVDQDCDGWSDYDADLDHFDSSAWTGDDCDDADRLVHPYAYEDPSDGVDNDCDGATDSADRDTITTLSLSDDDAEEISFDSVTIPFCGSDYTSAYVGSNGRLSFDYSSTSYSSSVSEMLGAGYPSIAGWWDDLNPASAGTVMWEEFRDGVAIYFLRVTEYGSTSNQTFSYLLLDDGSFILEFQNMDAHSGVVGWACGTGDVPDEIDLTVENGSLPEGSFGIGSGTDDAVYEEFLGDADVADTTLAFCAQSGTDSDGDGWTDNCGDSDDTDATVFPD